MMEATVARTRQLSWRRTLALVAVLVAVGAVAIWLGVSSLQPHTVKTLAAVVKTPGSPPSTIPGPVYVQANPGSSAGFSGWVAAGSGVVANFIAVAALVVRRR